MEPMVVIRPPSEANSLLLPLTLGCSHNRCTFCPTYKGTGFRIRNISEVKSDIDQAAKRLGDRAIRVFLENGDALVCRQSMLVEVLLHLSARFPNLERTATYASPQNLLNRSVADLKALRELGLDLVYLGVETGDDHLLKQINKGVTREQMVEAGQKAKEAGMILSVTILLGLGGKERSRPHALETASILTEIDPDYCGALTLMIVPPAPIYEQLQQGQFAPLETFEFLEELRLILANSRFSNCFFTSNHASNYLPLRLRLPQQKEEGLQLLDKVLSSKDVSALRPDYLRAL